MHQWLLVVTARVWKRGDTVAEHPADIMNAVVGTELRGYSHANCPLRL